MICQQHNTNTLKAQVISGNAERISKFEASERKIDPNADRKR